MGFLFPLKNQKSPIHNVDMDFSAPWVPAVPLLSVFTVANSGLPFSAPAGEIREMFLHLSLWAFGSRQDSHHHEVTLRRINPILTGLLMTELPTYHAAFCFCFCLC